MHSRINYDPKCFKNSHHHLPHPECRLSMSVIAAKSTSTSAPPDSNDEAQPRLPVISVNSSSWTKKHPVLSITAERCPSRLHPECRCRCVNVSETFCTKGVLDDNALEHHKELHYNDDGMSDTQAPPPFRLNRV